MDTLLDIDTLLDVETERIMLKQQIKELKKENEFLQSELKRYYPTPFFCPICGKKKRIPFDNVDDIRPVFERYAYEQNDYKRVLKAQREDDAKTATEIKPACSLRYKTRKEFLEKKSELTAKGLFVNMLVRCICPSCGFYVQDEDYERLGRKYGFDGWETIEYSAQQLWTSAIYERCMEEPVTPRDFKIKFIDKRK